MIQRDVAMDIWQYDRGQCYGQYDDAFDGTTRQQQRQKRLMVEANSGVLSVKFNPPCCM
jgi:hypothetical protein